MGLKANVISSEEKNSKSYLKDKISFKFKTNEYEEGNLKKKKNRKMKLNHIITKIKSKFHNTI